MIMMMMLRLERERKKRALRIIISHKEAGRNSRPAWARATSSSSSSIGNSVFVLHARSSSERRRRRARVAGGLFENCCKLLLPLPLPLPTLLPSQGLSRRKNGRSQPLDVELRAPELCELCLYLPARAARKPAFAPVFVRLLCACSNSSSGSRPTAGVGLASGHRCLSTVRSCFPPRKRPTCCFPPPRMCCARTCAGRRCCCWPLAEVAFTCLHPPFEPSRASASVCLLTERSGRTAESC